MVTFRHDRAGTPASAWRAREEWSRLTPLTGLDPASIDTVVVLAAHPDDESLGAGGLIATAHDLGIDVRLVVATAGERSHPRSPTHPPDALAVVRRQEVRRALAALVPGGGPDDVEVLDVPDGEVAQHERALVEHLVGIVGDGRRTLVVAPWRHDGHPDHEAAGRVAATTAARTGARLLEHPVWWWHWADPAQLAGTDWSALRALALTPDVVARKAAAVAAHRSQVAPLSDAPGDETLLGADLLEHVAGDVEVWVEQPAGELAGGDSSLDDLHADLDDPWGVDHRWYEERKRDVVLACLPRRRFARALEVGCSTGAQTVALADRCGELVAVDASPHAVAAATRRLADADRAEHVDVRLAAMPDQWPDGTFDLVVLSEVGYFLSPRALDDLVERVRSSLADDGVVVLCHWRHPVVGWVLDGPDVHERFVAAGVRPVAVEHRERDVEVLVLTADDVMPDPSR